MSMPKRDLNFLQDLEQSFFQDVAELRRMPGIHGHTESGKRSEAADHFRQWDNFGNWGNFANFIDFDDPKR
ncbi:hypothetical protein F183_A11950 [Bryobacterales bacterium F-183]|nr:hypothetical protein F183_A11950 [Bryobacterales bacterium F-183]